MRRRELLKSAAVLVASWHLPGHSVRSLFGASSPSNRINVGFIGLGNQSTLDLPAFLANDDVQVVAVCDVNTGSFGYNNPKHFLGRKPGQDSVNAHYAAQDEVRPVQGL